MDNKSASGFTLIEVLITLIILTIGMVGLMEMESLALRFNNASFLRSQAVIQAEEMAERMRANPSGVASGAYDNIAGIPKTIPVCSTQASSTAINCSVSDIANFDIAQWNTANALILPSGSGAVVASGGVFVITLSWREMETADAAIKTFDFEYEPLPWN